MILAMLAEFSYIPTTWNNTFHLTHWLLFLLVTLALTGSPTFYIAIVENQADDYMVRPCCIRYRVLIPSFVASQVLMPMMGRRTEGARRS